MTSLDYKIYLTSQSRRILQVIKDLQEQNDIISQGRLDVQAVSFGEIAKSVDLSKSSVGYHLREHLYGIVSVVMDEFGWRYQGKQILCTKYNGVYIPTQIKDKVDTIFSSNNQDFQSQVSNDSLPILKFILEQTMTLKKERGNNRQYLFHRMQIAKALKTNEETVSAALKDLIGIIVDGISVMNGPAIETVDKRKSWQYRQRVFLPKSRENMVKLLVSEINYY